VGRNELRDRRFEDLFRFDYPQLVAALRLVTGDDDRAREAVDEACARACERLARGHEIEVLGAWVRVVAFNVARDSHRRRRSERIVKDRIADLGSRATPDVSTAVAASVDVQLALGSLARQQREIVVLFYFLDHSVDAIAAELSIPAGTVKAALHRARVSLRSVLGDRAHSEGRTG
jgi:RNA polymerase sigma-70 factor (ECF subfamily)